MSSIDSVEIANGAIAKIREALPQIEVVVDASAPVELSVDIPIQTGLKPRINLNLQNVDELHFSVACPTHA